MALETATYIYGLVTTNPAGSDQKSTLDDHVRLIKAAIKRTFPNIDGEVSVSAAAINNTVAFGVRTNASQTISALHVYSTRPVYVLNGVAYQLGGHYGAHVDGSGTMVHPLTAGWSATYVGAGQYRVYHPLARDNRSGRLAVVASAVEGGRHVYVPTASDSTFVTVRMEMLDGSATYGGFSIQMVAY